MTPFHVLTSPDLGHLTHSARSAFGLLVAYYWDRGGLPADESIVAKICRSGPGRWHRLARQLRPLFDANWRHAGLDEAVAKRRRITEARRQSGRLGGLTKALRNGTLANLSDANLLICKGEQLGNGRHEPETAEAAHLCANCRAKLLIVQQHGLGNARHLLEAVQCVVKPVEIEAKPLISFDEKLGNANRAETVAEVSFPLEKSPHTPLKDYPLVSLREEKKINQRKERPARRYGRETKRGGAVSDTAQTLQAAMKPSHLADDFAEFWAAYPHQVGKADALRKYIIARRMVDQRVLLDAVARYVAAKPADRFWCNPGTWLHNGRWEDAPATTSAPVKVDPKRWVPPTDKNDPDYWENIVLSPVPPKESVPYGHRAA